MTSSFGPMTLGEIISELELSAHRDLEDYVKDDPSDRALVFDWCSLVPGFLDSYRGYYDHLAISIGMEGKQTVGVFLAACKDALGKTYDGWKGGSYVMGEDTPVWVANPGDCHGWGVAEISDDCGYQVVIRTEKFD